MKKTALALFTLIFSPLAMAGEFTTTSHANSGLSSGFTVGIVVSVCVLFAIFLLLGLRQIRRTFIPK